MTVYEFYSGMARNTVHIHNFQETHVASEDRTQEMKNLENVKTTTCSLIAN